MMYMYTNHELIYWIHMYLPWDCLRQIASEAITSKCWQLQEDIQETNISLGSWMHRSNSIIMNLSLLNKNLITGCNLRVSSSPQKVFGEKFDAIILLSSELVVPLWRDYDVQQASFSFLFLVWLGITGRYGCGWIIRIMIIYIMIIKNRNTAKNNNNNDDTDGTGDNNKAY